MKLLKKLMVASVAVAFASTAQSATIDQFVAVPGGEELTLPLSVNGISTSAFSAFGTSDFATVAVTALSSSISVGFPGSELLTFESVDQEFNDNAYIGLFSVTGGADAADWGDFALVSIALPAGVGFGTPGTLTAIEVAPVPLPAGALLLVSGMFALAIARRRLKYT